MDGHLFYFLAWASFGLVHSLLARPTARAGLERCFGAWHRLVYKGIAILHFSLVLGFGWALWPHSDFDMTVSGKLLLGIMAAAGALLAAVALAQHDVGRFLGWRQVLDARAGRSAPDEPLQIKGLYRLCRHPAYLGALLLFWGLATSTCGLMTAIWATIYLLIGVQFEERDLIRAFGPAYVEYRRRVPMLLPWKYPCHR